MIPLVLVTGFLGSGKTTFLRHLARDCQQRRLAFLVNEFADLNVDGARLDAFSFPVFEVSGGSLFCECKVTDFIANLKRLHEHFSDDESGLSGILIETSGIADPEVMAKLMADTGMDRYFRISSILALVSPYRFEDYLSAFPNLEAQIRTSDWVLLNKIDLADNARLLEVEARILAIKPEARICRTQHAAVDLDLWSADCQRPHVGALSACANPFASLCVTLPENLSRDRLRESLAQPDDPILRAKGWLREDGQLYSVDYSNGVFECTPFMDTNSASPRLVVIVDENREEWAEQWKRSLEAGALPIDG